MIANLGSLLLIMMENCFAQKKNRDPLNASSISNSDRSLQQKHREMAMDAVMISRMDVRKMTIVDDNE